MTARFVGSQELAQRRRRRLAQEALGLTSIPEPGRVSRSASDPILSRAPLPRTGVSYSGPRLPRETMIPGSWKVISALGGLGLLAWGAVIWLSMSQWSIRMGLADLVSLSGGAIPRYFSTVALLLTAQLSLLIYWHRSRSRKDFLGRYRIWGWAGLFWCVLCLANATQFHHPLLEYLESHVSINCWRGANLFWFIPLAIGMLTLYRLIGRDVNPSRPSTIAWNLSFCLGLLVAGLYFGLELLFPDSLRAPMRVGTTLLWQDTLAFFCLIHARYVTHVTNEAGARRPTLRSQMTRSLTPHLAQLGEGILDLGSPLRCLSWKRKFRGSEPSSAPQKQKKMKAVSAPAIVEAPRQSAAARGAAGQLVSEKRVAEQGTDKQSGMESSLVGKIDRRKTSARSEASQGTEKKVDSAGSLSWGHRLQQSLLGRWKRRIDPASASEDIVSPPHTPTKNARPERLQPASKPASLPTQPSVPPPVAAQSAPPPRQVSRAQQQDDDDDAGSSGNLGGMSNRERKRLKKLQRQQERA